MKYAIPFLFLLFCLGCIGKPAPPVLRIFCCEAYWDVIGDEAAMFATVYGTRIRRVPIFVPEKEEVVPKESETEPKRRSPAPWRSRPSERRTLAPGRTVVDARITELIRSLSIRTVHGDLYLTDSPKQVEMLLEGAAVTTEYPIGALALTLLVAKDNPLRIDSVKSLFDANRRLGIIDPSLDGMGEAAFRVVSKYLRTASGRSDERITPFDQHAKLLAALQNEEVDAVLVWEPLALKAADYAEVVELPMEERQAIPQQLIALSMANNQGYGKRFADFLISPKGREILKNHGFEGGHYFPNSSASASAP